MAKPIIHLVKHSSKHSDDVFTHCGLMYEPTSRFVTWVRQTATCKNCCRKKASGEQKRLEKMLGYVRLVGTMQHKRLQTLAAQRNPDRYIIMHEGHIWTGIVLNTFDGIAGSVKWLGTKTAAEKYIKILTKKLSNRDKFLIAMRAVRTYGNMNLWRLGQQSRYNEFHCAGIKDGWEFARHELQRLEES